MTGVANETRREFGDTVRRLLAARPSLRVLFITGYAAAAASRADFLAPGMDMITKPFALDDLAQKVKAILTD